jgi:ABC-type antimicrobial peptide transport system permease subunit
LVLLILLGPGLTGISSASTAIQGTVRDESGIPIIGAEVIVYQENHFLGKRASNPQGVFEFEAEPGTSYTLYTIADLGGSPGFDYLPSRLDVSYGQSANITLRQGGSLNIDGDVQFVDSENLPTSIVYAILDPSTGEVIDLGGVPLIYGSTPESVTETMVLGDDVIVVPADTPFEVLVNASVLIENEVEIKTFIISDPSGLETAQGGEISVDIREYSLPLNIEVLEELLGRLVVSLGEMGSVGFYVTVEQGMTDSASRSLAEAASLLRESEYVECFDALKLGYIQAFQTETRLASMVRDASLSVYSLIAFLTVSSTTVAFILANRIGMKALGSALLAVLSLTVLFLTFPGSTMVPLESYLVVGMASILLSLILAVFAPRVLKARGSDGHLPVRNIMVPIFSIAKRNIRRRKLRFAFTLVSLTVLVMSFVSLTSFSNGYGLVVRRVSGYDSPMDGVLIRSQGYTQTEPISIPIREIESGWLERQQESLSVAPKVESTPTLMTPYKLGSIRLNGILGIDPDTEGLITQIEDALQGGVLPSESGVIISETIQSELEVELGYTLYLDEKPLIVEGILDDRATLGLKELDGSSFLPSKLVNLDPRGENPQIVTELCEPSEFVVVHYSTALGKALTGITRISVSVDSNFDTGAFAERLALERGYMAWSTSPEGINLATLGSFFEGKGMPLLVPWAIVVLNVVITMMNSMFERREEIHILSSVGLNPAQIAAIFMSEAAIIGFTAGGLGYLSGLGVYKALSFFGLALEVRQKVSAFWSLASIGIAMTAVLMGAYAALRSSIVITPSLLRRWRMERRDVKFFEPYEMRIPVRFLHAEMEEYTDFVLQALKRLETHPTRNTSSIRTKELGDGGMRIDFVYKTLGTLAENFYTKNTLMIEKGSEEREMSVILRSFGDQEWAYTVGSLIRMISMRWSTTQKRLEVGEG